jgi:ABC-2 type transport system ATP-binding protein
VALTLDSLHLHYGATTALNGVTLQVRPGEIVGLLGPNGSGKSSTLAVAAGILTPQSGTATVDGIRRDLDPIRYAQHVGVVPQEPALYDELTAEANLTFFGKLFGFRGFDLCQRVDRMLHFARLEDRRRDRVHTFSGGMKQRLNLACALLHNPGVVLLDEPTAALDPASRDALFTKLHELRDRGHAILLSTHHLDEAEYGCDRIAVLEQGRIVACAKPSELIRHQPADRAVLYAHLQEKLPRFFERSLRRRMGPDVEVEVVGRRLRLSATTQEALGRALARVLADGIILETFRTPPGRLDCFRLQQPAETQGAPCDAT